MADLVGQTLAHYRVTAALGAGGMGEVYRATDTTLNRDVAIKVLPEEVAQDAERLARFRREAQLLASLNHTNIAAIYGLQEAEGLPFLALELVEGEDLKERLERGAIPVDESLDIAFQITEALEEAHEKGIVHRDLKPANVKLTPDGKVKVLDFGLAKAYAVEAASGSTPDLSQSPTLAHTGTAAGLILGTAAYMSPEQARGKPVDKRADIWAFGVMLWEMLTGQQLFTGETVSDVLAGVLTREPDWSRLPAGAGHLCPVLERCLERDSRRRLRDIGDVRMEIERARETGPVSATPTTPAPSGVRRAGLLLGVLVAGAAGALLAGLLRSGPEAPASLRLSIPLPASQQVGMSDDAMLVFSPDGSTLVVPVIEEGRRWLVRRRLDESSPERIEGTEGGRAPFFSPDGKWLGFISGDKLRKVAAEGGRPFALAEQNGAGGAAWGEDDRILFAPIYTEGLFRIPAEGGEMERVTTPDRARGELGHWWPQILPGGRTAIFTAFCTPLDTSRVGAVDLETGEVRDVVEGGFFGRYVPSGHLLYVKGARLFAAPFDPVRATTTGPAQSVLDDVFVAQTEALSLLDVSVDGTLAWVPGSVAEPEREVVWVDREGRTQPAVPERRRFRGVSISPGAEALATAILGESLDLWTYSLGQGTLSRLTDGPRTEFHPFWSRDGRSILFVVDRPPFEIHRIGVGGSGEGEALWETQLDTIPTGLSPDGRHVVYTLTEADTGKNVWVAPLDGSAPSRALRASPYEEDFGTFSPDGRWIAYQSDETGRPEIYAEAFPGPGERHQVTADGGIEPVWAHDSGEIFYRRGDEVRVVPTRTGRRFEFESSQVLFTLSFDNMGNSARNYDVTPDGQRVVAVRVPDRDAPRRIDIVTHWLDELSRQVPPADAN